MNSPDFTKNRLVPAIVQDADTCQVLMLGYQNREAWDLTGRTGLVHFYSRSRERIWKKGETSGNTLKLVSLDLDCDADAVLIKARPAGPTCHTGAASCFAGQPAGPQAPTAVLDELWAVITDRKAKLPTASYCASLFQKGQEKICKKVSEECLETILAATEDDNAHLVREAADLLFHLLVLLACRDIPITEVYQELKQRRRS